MRCFILRLLFFLFISLFAINIPIIANNQIDIAQSILEEHPDSAYKIAKAIEQKEGNHRFESAMIQVEVLMRYNLLWQATDIIENLSKTYDFDKNPKAKGTFLLKSGALMMESGNITLAKEKYQEALGFYTSATDSNGIGITYMHLGHIYEKQDKPKLALDFQLKALNIFAKLNDSIRLAQTYLNLGSIYEDNKDYETALNYFKKAEHYNSFFNDLNQRAEILNNIGDYYQKTDKAQLSISFFKKALNCARKSKDVHQEISALKDLSESYFQLQRFKAAYQVLDTANTLSKKNFFENNNHQVAGIQALNNIREKENKITLLQKDAIIRNSENYLFISLIGISMLIGLSLYLIYRQRLKKKEMEKEHQQMEYETKIKVAQTEEENLKNEIDIKNKTLSSYALQTVQDKKVLKHVYDQIKQIQKHPADQRDGYLSSITAELRSSLQDKNHWEEFKMFFDQVHPDFVHNLSNLNAELSAAEIRLSVLLRMNMNSKDIATILKISPDSVRIARYRLRKKLPIQQGDDLVNFISKI